MSSWTAACVNEGWREVRGEGGAWWLRKFSAKLERWACEWTDLCRDELEGDR